MSEASTAGPAVAARGPIRPLPRTPPYEMRLLVQLLPLLGPFVHCHGRLVPHPVSCISLK
eukprot:5583755-Amphidinium_carterae.3